MSFATITQLRPQLERHGLGYSRHFGDVRFQLSRLRESGGELKCQLRVGFDYTATGHKETLWRGSFNISSERGRSSMAQALSKRLRTNPANDSPIPWDSHLTALCIEVLDAEDGHLELEQVGSGELADEPRTLLGPMLVPDEINLLYAPGGSGKSTFAALIAVAMQTGAEVLPGWTPAITMPVLILDFEDRSRTWHERIRAICRGVNQDESRFHYLRIRGRLADNLEAISAVVTDLRIGLVIVDSVEAAAGVSDGDNWNDRVDRLWKAVGRLGATALMIDHTTASDARSDQADDMPFGGVFKVNWSRQLWRLQREKEPQDGRAELLLVDRKRNDGPKTKPIGFSIIYGPSTIRLERSTVEAPELVKSLSQPERIARFLKVNGPAPIRTISQGTGIEEPSVKAVLNRYKDRRFSKSADDTWALTHGG